MGEDTVKDREGGASKRRLARLFVIVSFGCTAAVAVGIGLSARRLASMTLLGAVVAAGGLWWAAGFFSRRAWRIDWLPAVAAANLAIVVPEVILRYLDYSYESGIQFGYPAPTDFIAYEPDEKLFWRLPTSEPLVNSLGFFGPEPSPWKAPGMYRMVFLGDSCTEQGYPAVVETMMNAAHGRDGVLFESVALAVAGYSSHQGRVLAEMYGEQLSPDVALVYFGWNDHWRAYGATDADKVVTGAGAKSGASQLLGGVYRHLRVAQAVNNLLHLSHDAAPPLSEARVPPDRYRENLLRIEEVFRERRVPVVFLTAPTSMYQNGVPAYLVEQRFVGSDEEALTQHRAYNEIVREVAARTGAHLLDLEAELARLPAPGRVFLADGIHLTPTGLAVVARRVADFLDSQVRK